MFLANKTFTKGSEGSDRFGLRNAQASTNAPNSNRRQKELMQNAASGLKRK